MSFQNSLRALVAFIILASSTALAQSYTIKQTHPRIWITPERLENLKEYAQRNGGQGTARWRALKAVADDSKGARTRYMSDYDRIFALCLVYLVNGDAGNAAAAAGLMRSLAVNTNTLTRDNYYDYRSAIPAMAAGYDWCFTALTQSDREQVATWLMNRADQVWPDTNPARSSGWAVDNPANNYFYGFLTTWIAALAVFGDGADTGTGAVSGSDRPHYHVDLGLRKFETLTKPWAAGWGRGGVFAESTNYDSSMRLGTILDAHRTASGTSLFDAPSFPLLRDSIYWRIFSTVPTGNYYYSLGDQPRESGGPISDYDRARAFVPAFRGDDPAAKAYAKHWLDHITPNTSSWAFQVGWEFLYYDEGSPSADYTQSLPTSFHAPGSGVFIKRSDWTSGATYWGIWAGPLKEGHQDRNVNGFLIWKGNNWLVGNANMYSASGIEAASAFHNNLTFGGIGQVWQTPSTTWPEEAGKILKREDSAEYTLFEGQAAQAYTQDRSHDRWVTRSSQLLATDYVRKLIYLPAIDSFLIYDRVELEAEDKAKAKEWHLHSRKPIMVDGRSFSFDNDQYRIHGRSLLPLADVTVAAVPVNAGPGGAVSSHRLDVLVAGDRTQDYLLTTLQIAPLSGGAAHPVTLVQTTGAAEGAELGNWLVLFGRSEVIEGVFAYTVSDRVTRHLVADLKPSTSYTLLVRDAGGTELRTAAVATNSVGTLRFDRQTENERQFVLTPGDVVPDRLAPAAPGSLRLLGP